MTPWTPEDAPKFNSGITSTRQRHVWAGIANEQLSKHGDEGRAVRAANSAFKPRHERAAQKQVP